MTLPRVYTLLTESQWKEAEDENFQVGIAVFGGYNLLLTNRYIAIRQHQDGYFILYGSMLPSNNFCHTLEDAKKAALDFYKLAYCPEDE